MALAFGLLAAATSASAHRRDEYLQAAYIAIDPDLVRIELDLTPGITVADDVLSHIDRDHDGSISPGEGNVYVDGVLAGLTLDVDGTPLAVRVVDRTFPSVDALRRGEGTIRVDVTATLPRLAAGAHRLRYRNSHRGDIGVYLANALVPTSDRIAVTGQRRDVDQRALEVAFTAAPPPRHHTLWALATGLSAVMAAALCGVRRMA